MKKSVLILSFSPVARDARVLRQVFCLAEDYRVKVVGLGEAPAGFSEKGIGWVNVDERLGPLNNPIPGKGLAGKLVHLSRTRDWKTLLNRMGNRWNAHAKLPATVLFQRNRRRLERFYWANPRMAAARDLLLSEPFDAFVANDWNALPPAGEAAERFNARLVFDAHEYAPLEYSGLRWRMVEAPLIVHLLKTYAPRVDAAMTVGENIAAMYEKHFGLSPTVVFNTPGRVEIPGHETDPDRLNIIHHGSSSRVRKLEDFIHILKGCDERYRLHYMLTGTDPEYIRELKNLSEKLTPGRVFFHDPVPTDRVVREISRWDLSLCFKKPICFNEKHCLPNKFFDSILAGLAVISGPSPEMERIIRRYGLGEVSRSFELSDVSALLNRLAAGEISEMREQSRKAAADINAETEMKKLSRMFAGLFGEGEN